MVVRSKENGYYCISYPLVLQPYFEKYCFRNVIDLIKVSDELRMVANTLLILTRRIIRVCSSENKIKVQKFSINQLSKVSQIFNVSVEQIKSSHIEALVYLYIIKTRQLNTRIKCNYYFDNLLEYIVQICKYICSNKCSESSYKYEIIMNKYIISNLVNVSIHRLEQSFKLYAYNIIQILAGVQSAVEDTFGQPPAENKKAESRHESHEERVDRLLRESHEKYGSFWEPTATEKVVGNLLGKAADVLSGSAASLARDVSSHMVGSYRAKANQKNKKAGFKFPDRNVLDEKAQKKIHQIEDKSEATQEKKHIKKITIYNYSENLDE